MSIFTVHRVFFAGLASITFAQAVNHARPESGDTGSIEHGPGGGWCDHDAGGCHSCLMQREAFENNENNENNETHVILPDAPAETCIDKCSARYVTTQLDVSYVWGANAGEISAYRNLKIEPEVECIDGCRCPTGFGTQLINENEADPNNDDYSYEEIYGYGEQDQEQDQGENAVEGQYDLTFSDGFGNDDSGFVSGHLSIIRDEGFPEILLVISYNALRVEYEIDEYGETAGVELSRSYQPIECGVRYYVGTGKVFGLTSVNATQLHNSTYTKKPVEYNQEPSRGMVVMATEQTVNPGSGCTVEEYHRDFHEGDWCTYQCMQSFFVDGDGNGVVGLTPSKAYQSFNCICPPGKGMLVGDSSSHAQIAFSADAEKVCTSEFNGGQHLVDFQASNPDHDGKMTMEVKMHSGARCTFEYELVSGTVLSANARGYYANTAKDINQAVLALIVSLVIVVLFVAPSVYKNKYGYTTAIFLMSRKDNSGPQSLPTTIYGTSGGNESAESTM